MEGIVEPVVELQPPQLHEHGGLPEAEVAQPRPLPTREAVSNLSLARREPVISQIQTWCAHHPTTLVAPDGLGGYRQKRCPRSPRPAMLPRMRLDPATSLLAIIDVQERLLAALPDAERVGKEKDRHNRLIVDKDRHDR